VTSAGKPNPSGPLVERQRLDKWLWFARVVKTRSSAARLVEEGHVRINTARVDNPAKAVKIGDVLTIALDRHVRVLRVNGHGLRRGPYEEAKRLFDDLSGPTSASDHDDGDE
jgi:ribosome-associated heat shock protein Hsp15